jgi:Interferon-induced transmembrane protein
VNCTRCGTTIPDEHTACPHCGLPRFAQHQASPPPPPPPPPPRTASYLPPQQPSSPPERASNYIIQSILITICCCQPLGIIAIIFSAVSMAKQSSGDYAGAREMAAKARLFCWIGFLVGLAAYIVFLVIYGTAGFLEFFERTAG